MQELPSWEAHILPHTLSSTTCPNLEVKERWGSMRMEILEV